MNDTEIRAYAVRGLTARLAELDVECQRIHGLIAEWSGAVIDESPRRRSMSADARQRIGEATRKRWSERRATAPGADTPPDVDAAVVPAVDAARVLPRRGTSLRHTPSAPPVPALPPMPRLIKNAS